MAQCSYCQSPLSSDARTCPACGREVSPVAPAQTPAAPPAWGAQPTGAEAAAYQPSPAGATARQLQDQATTVAKETWVKIQAAGPAKVGVGLMAVSLVFWVWGSQRGIWSAGLRETIPAVLLMAYVGMREIGGRDLLGSKWWAPLAASTYLLLWGLSGIGLKLGSLVFLAGAGLLAWSYFWPLRSWAVSMGVNWRYGLHGYRRPVAVGALLAFLSLFLNWVPANSQAGYFYSGLSYSSYKGGYEWSPTAHYMPGFYFPAYKGIDLTGAVIMAALLLASLLYAMLVPQFAVPRWYRYIPLFAVGYGIVFMLAGGSLSYGQLFFVVGAGLMGWGGFKLGVKGEAEGPGDLRQLPLHQWLAKWL